MPEAEKIAVRPRTITGKKVERLRRQGILPGVVFGGHADSVPLETDAHAFELGHRRWGRTTLLTLEGLDGGEVRALIHDVSRDPRTGRMLHVDFARVSLTEVTHAEVPLHFVGSSGAVRNEGAVLLHALDHVRVEALPQDIPHRIDVDLSPLDTLENAVHIRDLAVDRTKVKILNDPDDLVVKPAARRAEEIAPTPAAAPEAAVVAPTAEGAPTEGAPAPAAGAAGKAPAAAGKAPTAAGKAPAGGAKGS